MSMVLGEMSGTGALDPRPVAHLERRRRQDRTNVRRLWNRAVSVMLTAARAGVVSCHQESRENVNRNNRLDSYAEVDRPSHSMYIANTGGRSKLMPGTNLNRSRPISRSPTATVRADEVSIFASQPTNDAICMENSERVARKCVLAYSPFLGSNGQRPIGVE